MDAAQDDRYPHNKNLSTLILNKARRLYITLHEGTNSSPTAFSTTTEDGNRDLDDTISYPRCLVIGHHPSRSVPALQINEPPSHGPRNARFSINDPTEVTPEVSSVSTPLSVLPPAFIRPTQVPPRMPVSTRLEIPGAAPAAPALLGTGGAGAAAVIHSQTGDPTPEVPGRFQRHAPAVTMDMGSWPSAPRLVRISYWLMYPRLTAMQPSGSSTQSGTVSPIQPSSTQPGAGRHGPLQFTPVQTSLVPQ